MLVTQSCLILCNPMDYKPPGSSVHWILQARILEWVATPFSRGVFLTQGSNTGLSHRRQVLYHLSHQGSPLLQVDRVNLFIWIRWSHKLYRDHLLLFHPTDDACLRLTPVRNAVWELELVDNITFCDFVQEKSVEPSRSRCFLLGMQ